MTPERFTERAPKPADPVKRFVTRCTSCGEQACLVNAEFMHQWQEQHVCPTKEDNDG